ncbi:MAG: insulinase family protein [Saprospiraceae bacterium]|nr:insulinase family protein [Saprospiraceae bacterium]
MINIYRNRAGSINGESDRCVRVVMKPTTFKNDQILLTAYSPGGHSVYQDKDFYSASSAAAIIEESGVGQFDLIALEKKLADKTVSLSPYIGELYEGFSGNSSVEDFEVMLKLVYLYATEPRKDQDAFERYIGQSKEELGNISSNPMYYFYDQMYKTKFKNHPRRKIIPEVSDLDKIDFNRSLEIYKDRFSDFSDFTFVLVGNFEPAKIQGQLEQYLGSLPSKNRKENWNDMNMDMATEGATQNLQKGMAPQCNVYIGFNKKEKWSRSNAHHVQSMSQVLNIMVRENLREEKGGVYSPRVAGSFMKEPIEASDLMVIFQCAPEDAEELIEAVKKEIADLQKNGPSQENFEKIKEQQRRARETNLEKNRFWLRSISSYYKSDRNLEDIETYGELIENLTKEDIKKAANNFIDLDKAIIVTVKPEKETETEEKP